MFIRFSADVDFQKNHDRAIPFGCFLLQDIQEPDAVDRVNQMNERKSGFNLVALQVSDLMPADARSGLRQVVGFPPQLLWPAFAQSDNSQRWQQSSSFG